MRFSRLPSCPSMLQARRRSRFVADQSRCGVQFARPKPAVRRRSATESPSTPAKSAYGRLKPEQSSSSSPKTGRSQARSREIFERLASGCSWPTRAKENRRLLAGKPPFVVHPWRDLRARCGGPQLADTSQSALQFARLKPAVRRCAANNFERRRGRLVMADCVSPWSAP